MGGTGKGTQSGLVTICRCAPQARPFSQADHGKARMLPGIRVDWDESFLDANGMFTGGMGQTRKLHVGTMPSLQNAWQGQPGSTGSGPSLLCQVAVFMTWISIQHAFGKIAAVTSATQDECTSR